MDIDAQLYRAIGDSVHKDTVRTYRCLVGLVYGFNFHVFNLSDSISGVGLMKQITIGTIVAFRDLHAE